MGNEDELRRRREQHARDEAQIKRMREQHAREEAEKAAKLARQNAEAIRAYESGVEQAKKTGGKPPAKPKVKQSGGCAILLIAGLGGLAGLGYAAAEAVRYFV